MWNWWAEILVVIKTTPCYFFILKKKTSQQQIGVHFNVLFCVNYLQYAFLYWVLWDNSCIKEAQLGNICNHNCAFNLTFIGPL